MRRGLIERGRRGWRWQWSELCTARLTSSRSALGPSSRFLHHSLRSYSSLLPFTTLFLLRGEGENEVRETKTLSEEEEEEEARV